MQIEIACEIFGEVSLCKSVSEIANFIENHVAMPGLRRKAAIFGMLIVTLDVVYKDSSFEGSINLLTKLANTKVEMDAAAWHSLEVVEATAELLLSAQRYFNGATYSCVEWPTNEEISKFIYQMACQLVRA